MRLDGNERRNVCNKNRPKSNMISVTHKQVNYNTCLSISLKLANFCHQNTGPSAVKKINIVNYLTQKDVCSDRIFCPVFDIELLLVMQTDHYIYTKIVNKKRDNSTSCFLLTMVYS